MNINESVRDWINENLPNFPDLDTIDIVTMGEQGDLEPPFLAIFESSAEPVQQGEVVMHGITAYEVTVELHTVPTEVAESGTPAETERSWRRQIYDIIGNRNAIGWANGRNQWTIFDIRCTGPITEAGDGVRISRWILTIIACPS